MVPMRHIKQVKRPLAPWGVRWKIRADFIHSALARGPQRTTPRPTHANSQGDSPCHGMRRHSARQPAAKNIDTQTHDCACFYFRRHGFMRTPSCPVRNPSCCGPLSGTVLVIDQTRRWSFLRDQIASIRVAFSVCPIQTVANAGICS